MSNATEGATAPRKGRRKTVAIVVTGVALLAALGFGLPYYLHSLHHESTDDAYVEGTVAPVSFRIAGHVLRVHVADNQRIAAGELLAELDPAPFEVDVRQAKAALAAARAARAAATTGVELARETTAADLDAARAGLRSAEGGVQSALASVESARGDLAAARIAVRVAGAVADEAAAQVTASEAMAENDADDLARLERLFREGTSTRESRDHAASAARVSAARLAAERKTAAAAAAKAEQAAVEVTVAEQAVARAEAVAAQARAAVGEAQARLAAAATAPARVQVAEAGQQSAEALVEAARAAVARAELALSFSRLTAPVAGRVTKKSLTEGQWVQPGQAVCALVPDGVWVVANFKETQVGVIRPGQTVAIEVDAYPGETFRGRVDSIQAGTGARFSLLPPENATGNYVKVVQRVPVKIVFDPLPDPARFPLLPGLSVVPDVDVSGD